MITTVNNRIGTASMRSYETVCASISMDGGDMAGLRGDVSPYITYFSNPSGSSSGTIYHPMACNNTKYA